MYTSELDETFERMPIDTIGVRSASMETDESSPNGADKTTGTGTNQIAYAVQKVIDERVPRVDDTGYIVPSSQSAGRASDRRRIADVPVIGYEPPIARTARIGASEVSDNNVDAIINDIINEITERNEDNIDALLDDVVTEHKMQYVDAVRDNLITAVSDYARACASVGEDTVRASVFAIASDALGIESKYDRAYLVGEHDATWCDMNIRGMLKFRRAKQKKHGLVIPTTDSLLGMLANKSLLQDEYVDDLSKKYGILAYAENGDDNIDGYAMPFETSSGLCRDAVDAILDMNDRHTFNVNGVPNLRQVLPLVLYPMMRQFSSSWRNDGLVPHDVSGSSAFKRDVLKPIVTGLSYQILFEVSNNSIRSEWYRHRRLANDDIVRIEDRIDYHITHAYELIAANRKFLTL